RDWRLAELIEPAIYVVENITGGGTKPNKRNIGGGAILAVHEKTGLTHFGQWLRLPIRRRRHIAVCGRDTFDCRSYRRVGGRDRIFFHGRGFARRFCQPVNLDFISAAIASA